VIDIPKALPSLGISTMHLADVAMTSVKAAIVKVVGNLMASFLQFVRSGISNSARNTMQIADLKVMDLVE